MMLLVLVLVGTTSAFAQSNMDVSGTILDNAGVPMVGVTVMEQGTTNGTVTDLDGNYSIKVPQGATLIFSFIGYNPQEVIVNDSKINVTLLEELKDLDEIVVVGYGVQKKSSVTGAVSQVKSEDMQARTITNANQALQGKTAGVQVLSSSAKPGASPSVRIRGIGSNGDSSPLYVVDGRIASDIGGIDPNDIESMEVLKDGASAAIYGASAGNGVILITTKRGKGDGKISYDFQLTRQKIGRVPQVMNAEEFMQYFIDGGIIGKETFYNNWDFKTNTNWVDAAFETSTMKHHNVTFQAGSDKGSLYLSMSYLNNDGIVIGSADNYRRLTGMINANWNIKSWLEISTNNQIEHYKSQSVAEGSEYGSLLSSVLQLDPLTKVTYTVDDMPDNMRDILNNSEIGELLSDGKGNYYGISPFVTLENVNPLIMRDNSFTKSRGYNINGTTSLVFKPINELVVTSRLGYRLSGSESYGVGKDYYANDQAHQNYISLNASAYAPTYYQWENFANYMRDFNGHNVSLMIGSSFSESRSFGVSGSKNGKDKSKDETTGEVTERDLGVMKDDPLFWYFAYATSTAIKNVSGGEPSYTKKLAYFGRLSYDYLGRYMAQFSLRADAADSSVLPIDKRWGYFPAASLGWTVSQENFMDNTRAWLDMLKVRASWGQNGSVASLGGYSYANVIASSGNYPTTNSGNFGYITGYAPSSTGNDELKWETSEQVNFGIDARFLNSRLTLTADYFKKKTKDLIVSGITPSTVVGNTASPVNAGDIENKGLEVEVGWQDHIGDFSYGVRANIATLKNEVTYIHPTLKDGIGGASFHTYGTITRFEVGNPAWYFYGYKFKGINKETGNPEFYDINNDGDINDNDRTNIGKGMADFTYGMTITAGWKGFDFIVFGTGSAGNDIYCCLNRSDKSVNKLKDFVDDRWTPTNTNGTKPRAGANDMDKYMTSDASVFSGNYFKIKQIQLGYNLPKNILKKFQIENVRIYGSLEDYFTFAKYPGFDPEVTGVGSSLGVDKGSYPNSKKVVFGFNVTF
ncbi:MAG: TonB-dependent receptor [Bacteroidales bacterium]|nr:TonB-dependent receptor [Bacteroidales bacterium]